MIVAAVGEIRQNPGGRRVLVLFPITASENVWATLQLNGPHVGDGFGVPAEMLDKWRRIGTLPPDDYAPTHGPS